MLSVIRYSGESGIVPPEESSGEEAPDRDSAKGEPIHGVAKGMRQWSAARRRMQALLKA
ncbi:hypothetical protein GCM10010911_59100 [Paenibacillus nasutitermitis]|uniref:Uncharacterized protein n=1 Tax=Paenibacillus nasutitermitis TaxID=1652958 RepID=A0A917E1J5_9BACL|nr:hypothetical protein GCM10010911_59100 [Paenibacillus nasutitermitis]